MLLLLYNGEPNIFLSFSAYKDKPTDLESGSDPASKAKAGTASYLIELEKRRAIKAGGYVN